MFIKIIEYIILYPIFALKIDIKTIIKQKNIDNYMKTELEILNEIKFQYCNLNLNESDTRFKIIDSILVEVLKWTRDTIDTEKYIDGNRADYILKGKNEKPVLIIESKKNEVYFELPQTINSNNTSQKILLEKLLTDKSIKEAIFQVKEYAEDLSCKFACICNGKSWIFFKVQSTQKPWKKLPAFVIYDIDFFIQDLTLATNMLSYHNVINNDSLQNYIGISKKSYSEIFYPKSNITTYDTIVDNNKFAGSLKTISTKFLGPIPESDNEFMKKCYVTNKGAYDNLQKDVQGFLHDSLTPFFKNMGVRDFTDNNNGGAFGTKITEIIKKEKLNNVMILFGGRGAGKSTFLKRFLFHTQPIEISIYSKVALIGLLYSSQTKEELSSEIWSNVLISIDTEKLRQSERATIIDLFKDEFEIYEKQILQGLNSESIEYNKFIIEFIQDKLNNIKLFCEKISLRWKDKNKSLVIFIDNVDQLPPELQDVCFLTAGEISEKLSCLVIISMREERYFDASSRGVLDAYQSPSFHLSSPVIPEVITKRIDYIIENLYYTKDLDTEFGIKNDSVYRTLVAFLKICKNQLKINKSPLSFFLRYATHGDVRQALEFFKGFITSGYTNIAEMAPHSDWKFQVHQVVKPMMIPERFFYDERKSKISNLYQLRNDIDSSHFTGLRIMHYLHNKQGDKSSNGYIDVKFLIQKFDEKYDSKNDCIKHLELYLEKGMIEANNRLDKFSENVNQIKLTSLGNYVYEYLAFNFAYIDLVCIDCGIFDEKLSNFIIKSAGKELNYYYDKNFMSRIELRIARVKEFINYLVAIEEQEFIDLNLDKSEIKFTSKIIESIYPQMDLILASAKNKQSYEN
jgi:hypothetical protein